MASKAAQWAEKYRAAEEVKTLVRGQKPGPIILWLHPSRSIEVCADEYGRGPRMRLPGSHEHELVEEKALLAFARSILDTFGDDAKETTP